MKIKKGFIIVTFLLLLSILLVNSLSANAATNQFNVLNFGAVGDGRTDNSQAFLRAWNAACNTVNFENTVIVPGGGTFLLKETQFIGPCKASKINFQIYSDVVAPANPSEFTVGTSNWLVFESVNGLTVDGTGIFDGKGSQWWKRNCKFSRANGCSSRNAPNMVLFTSCNGLVIKNVKFMNSPLFHIIVLSSNGVNITNISVTTPADAPNTDGIHLMDSSQVYIQASTISTGDDCISIGTGTNNLHITGVNCGPGHGISIGSLGENGSGGFVENVHVSHCNFYGTTNGARIKTWKGGKGFVKYVTFDHLNFFDVSNPVIIDQFYVNNRFTQLDNQASGAMQVTYVTYSNLFGTSKTEIAVNLMCSITAPCTGLVFDTVNITSPTLQVTEATCSNAKGSTTKVVSPAISCLT